MSLNPLKELKRRLDDHETPLPKRLCLARNIIKSHHFPSAPKERVVADWLQELTKKNKLTSEELRNVIGWLNVVDDATSELKSKLIQIVSQFLKRNPLQKEDVPSLLSFLENPKLSSQFSFHIEECLSISITLLQFLKSEDTGANTMQSQRVFNNIIQFYKDSKKKLEFILKLIDGENLETIFSYLDTDGSTVVAVCGSILFPMNKKSFFGIFLQTLVRKDSIQDLIAERGDNIQSVLKIMDAFFKFPKGRTVKDETFLANFIDVFVSCYYSESQLIFAFYVMVASCLNMEQNYLVPAMKLTEIVFEENSDKIKRNLFLGMLDTVLKNEVDINVRLTDTLGVKIAKVETKKTLMQFLESLMLRQFKMDKKPDKATFEIIKTALKVDPVLIEHKMSEILPIIMAARKSPSTLDSYTQMLNCLLETLFKLSRGNLFLNQILPNLKNSLETSNTEQFELKQKFKMAMESGEDCEKITNKIISGNDVFPEESIELFGKLTSELMFRQNKDLLLSLQKNFENHCLESLDEISPSTLVLTEVLSAILSSVLRYNKMADHTVPLNIAQDFWATFKDFEMEFMKKFGMSVLKNIDEPQLLHSFLKLCRSCSQLKLLNISYSNTKVDVTQSFTSEVFDLSVLLPCLSEKQWTTLATHAQTEEAVLIMDEILLIKTMAIQILKNEDNDKNDSILPTKSHLIKHLSKNSYLIEQNNYLSKVLLADLDKSQLKQVAKIIVKLILNTVNADILNNYGIGNHRMLQSALVLETVKNIFKCFDNAEFLSKNISKTEFDLASLSKEEMKENFTQMAVKDECRDDSTLPSCVEILKNLKIGYLEESYQLVVILAMLAIKKSCQKKLRKNVDHVLLSTFELSPNPPDLYKIFSVDFIFSFKDRTLIDLLILKIKTSNQMFVIKCLVESAVKRVKMESEIVKRIVELLLKKQSASKATSIEFFSDPAFQISCTILPAIVKQKKAITISAYRSILADLQEKLHISLLNCFKNINFKEKSSIHTNQSSNTDESMVVSESTLATLNAIAAYSLTLSKYCETTDAEEIKNLDYLWTGLEYFVNNSIQSIQTLESKQQHVDSSIRLLSTVLRYYKKLETHEIFQTKDKLFLSIWHSVKARLSMVLDGNMSKKFISSGFLEDVGVTLRFLCELISVECFVNNFVGDFNILAQFENPSKMSKKPEHAKSILTSHKVSKHLWSQILKANIVGPKCVALSKSIYQSSRNLRGYIQQHFEGEQNGVVIKSKKKKLMVEFQDEDAEYEVKVVNVDDSVCEMMKIYLDTLTEAVLAAKKINLDYKALDSIFELHQAVQYILGRNSIRTRCEVSWQAFYLLFEGAVQVLNGLIVSREELLEDRWPCFMQCYRACVALVCQRAAATRQLENAQEERLGELAHSLEKLTQSICKRKTHVSKIAAYTVGDICSHMERSVPARAVSARLQASTSVLLQASDAPHAQAFVRRALGASGAAALARARTVYRAAHKYTGNA